MTVIDTASVKRSGAGGFTNIGSFASLAKLKEAYPVPADGLAALVGIGDGSTGNEKEYVSDGQAWHELAGGSTSGVSSVNGESGDVVLGAEDVGADEAGAASAAVSAHVGEADPHTQYQKESEKDQASGYAGLDASGDISASAIPASGVVAGTYSNPTVVIGDDGRVSSATNGAASGTVTGTGTSGKLAKWTSSTAIGDATAGTDYPAPETSVQEYTRDVIVRAASTANLTLSGTQTVDGIALVAGDYFLAKNQTTASQNGVYVVAASAWTRATEFSTTNDFNKKDIFVTSGTTLSGTWWLSATKNPTVGTTSVTFTQIPNGIGTSADMAAAGNHAHTSIAATAASSFSNTLLSSGAFTNGAALLKRYTSRTATAATATTDNVVVMSGSTAAQIETMPDGVAVANSSGRVIRYVNNASVDWLIRQSASNTLNGSTSDFTLKAGRWIEVFNTADNAWVISGYGLGGTESSGGSGTVTSVSVASANGFAGTVANATTTPAITLTTSITGLLKGNGTALSAAVAGTDYQSPIGTISGLAKGNGANALTAAVAGTDYLAPNGSGAALTGITATSVTFSPTGGVSAANVQAAIAELDAEKANTYTYQGSSFTAALDGNYVTTATLTVTDPTPLEGKGYYVLVQAGTATIGGTDYSTAGMLIRRSYTGGAWSNTTIGTAGGSSGGEEAKTSSFTAELMKTYSVTPGSGETITITTPSGATEGQGFMVKFNSIFGAIVLNGITYDAMIYGKWHFQMFYDSYSMWNVAAFKPYVATTPVTIRQSVNWEQVGAVLGGQVGSPWRFLSNQYIPTLAEFCVSWVGSAPIGADARIWLRKANSSSGLSSESSKVQQMPDMTYLDYVTVFQDKASVSRYGDGMGIRIEVASTANMVVGEYVTLSGFSNSSFNMTAKVGAINDATHFTIYASGITEAETADTGGIISFSGVRSSIIGSTYVQTGDYVIPYVTFDGTPTFGGYGLTAELIMTY